MINRQLVITGFDSDIRKATKFISSEIPKLQAHDVLVKNTYVGINAIYDRELYRGRISYIKVDFPYVFGVEAVGRVVEVGSEVTELKVGQAVSTVKVGTAYQEYQVTSASMANAITEDAPEYLTINPTGISAHLALIKTAEIKKEDLVVVSAAAGGLGHIIVQLCKMKGCHVVAICGSNKKVELLKSLNSCDRIINHRNESVKDILSTTYNGRIDVGIDSVGRHMFDALIANMAPLGRLVICGLAAELSEESFEIVTRSRVYEQMYWQGVSIRCFMNHLYKSEHEASRIELTKMYENDALKIKVDETKFEGIESLLEASEYLLAGRSVGKVVVKL